MLQLARSEVEVLGVLDGRDEETDGFFFGDGTDWDGDSRARTCREKIIVASVHALEKMSKDLTRFFVVLRQKNEISF